MTLNTSKTHSAPDTLDWQAIQEFKDLPILPTTRTAFQRSMHTANLSFEGLAKIAEQDPAVCLHMLLRIYERSPNSLDQISSAAGCISLLGMEEVVRLVKNLPVLTSQPIDRHEINYMTLLHSAILAGHIASRWANFKSGLNPHQAQWSAMLASAPLWPWQLKQVSANQASLDRLTAGSDIIPALQFGYGKFSPTPSVNWQMLAQNLALPKTCQSLWQGHRNNILSLQECHILRKQPLTFIEDRELKLKCQQPEVLIFFANALATHYRFGSSRNKSKRWLALCAHFLNKNTLDIHQETLTLILQMARQGHVSSAVFNLLTPSHCLSSLQPRRSVAKPVPAKSSHVIKDSSVITSDVKTRDEDSQQRQMDKATIKTVIKDLRHSPASFGNWHNLIHAVLKTIIKGIGLEHAFLMVRNTLGTAAKVYYHQGLIESDPLCNFSISLDKNNIFKTLLQKPVSLMITHDNRDRMLKGITPAQKAMLPQQFMMTSLFSNERPIGIIFADAKGSAAGEEIKAEEYNAFKSLCNATSSSLGIISNSKKKQNDSSP